MAYYDPLKAAWNSTTLPAGVTGTALTSSMTVQQKMDNINAWTMTGTVPASFNISGDQIANCINAAEFNALAPALQSNLLGLCAIPGQLLGGTANTALLPMGMCLAVFPGGSATRASLTALAKGVVMPWWQVPAANGGAGLSSPVNQNDLTAAGLV